MASPANTMKNQAACHFPEQAIFMLKGTDEQLHNEEFHNHDIIFCNLDIRQGKQ